MKKPRCAVLGVGYLGRFHAQKYANIHHVDFIGVYDTNLTQAKNVASELNVSIFSELKDLVGAVDLVSIAAITPVHYELALFCLSHGIHVLIEKPMTQTVHEADELIALAKHQNLVLQVGHLERYNPAQVQFLPYLKKPQMIECQRLATFKKRGSEVDVILDLMIHDLDIILSWVKSPVVAIHGQGIRMLTDGFDLASVSLRFENGSSAQLTASRVHANLERITRVYQDKDYFSLNYQTQTLTQYTAIPHTELGHALKENVYQSEKQDALMTQIQNFIARVQGKDVLAVDGQAGRQALALALDIQHNIQRVKNFV